MTLQPCSNCLATLEPEHGRCPVCWAFADGHSGTLTLFDDAARGEIRDFGGAFEIFVSVPGRSHLVWCETGLFRFDAGRGVVWRTPTIGALNGVGLRQGLVVVNEYDTDGGWRFDWATGAAV